MILDDDRFGPRDRGQYDLDPDDDADAVLVPDIEDDDEQPPRDFLNSLSAQARADRSESTDGRQVEVVATGPRSSALARLIEAADLDDVDDVDEVFEVVKPADVDQPRSAALVKLLQASRASSTWVAYEKDLKYFGTWLLTQRHGIASTDRDEQIRAVFTATTRDVAEYIAAISEGPKAVTVSTIKRRLYAIRRAFKIAGRPNPLEDVEIAGALDGAARTLGVKQRRVEALNLNQLRHLVVSIPIANPKRPEWRNRRDQVLLLVGWSAALRASELVALDVGDIRFDDPDGDTRDPSGGGMIVNIKRSKTDQYGKGEDVLVNYSSNPSTCPVRKTFLHIRQLRPNGYGESPLFRTAKGDRLHKDMVARILKEQLHIVYNGQVDTANYSAHSLRAGFVTEASDRRVDPRTIAQTTRHQSLAMIRTYDRPENRFDNSALAGEWW